MSKLLEIPEEAYRKVPEYFDRTEESFQEDVASIKKWMSTQPHLPEIMADILIQNFLILNKCSIEKTKLKIDMYYTVRNLIPDIYQYSNPTEKELVPKAVSWVSLPKMTKEMYRITVTKILDEELFQKLDPYKHIAYLFNTYEIRLKEDYMFGDIVIMDLGKNLKMMTKWSPALLSKTFFIYEKVFSNRLKAFYLINSPPYVDTFLTILKSVMKPKIFERIRVCTDDSILLKELSPEFVPKDYGGQASSVQEYQELWSKKILEYRERFEYLANMKVNEELRPEKLKNDDMLGFHGNFKKLSID